MYIVCHTTVKRVSRLSVIEQVSSSEPSAMLFVQWVSRLRNSTWYSKQIPMRWCLLIRIAPVLSCHDYDSDYIDRCDLCRRNPSGTTCCVVIQLGWKFNLCAPWMYATDLMDSLLLLKQLRCRLLSSWTLATRGRNFRIHGWARESWAHDESNERAETLGSQKSNSTIRPVLRRSYSAERNQIKQVGRRRFGWTPSCLPVGRDLFK